MSLPENAKIVDDNFWRDAGYSLLVILVSMLGLIAAFTWNSEPYLGGEVLDNMIIQGATVLAIAILLMTSLPSIRE